MNEFVVKKEAEKRELAKKRSPAHDFQRQIKFDPKQHPELRKEEQHPKWKREFSAIADAQGFADVLDLSIDRSTLSPEQKDLDDVRNKVLCPAKWTCPRRDQAQSP